MNANNGLLSTLEELGICKMCVYRFTRNTVLPEIESKVRCESNKSMKCNPCIICLGLLQQSITENIAKKVRNVLEEANYDCLTYMIAIILPSCFYLREHSLNLYLKTSYPRMYEKEEKLPYFSLKDACRYVISSVLSSSVGKDLDSKSDLVITIDVSYVENAKECSSLAVFMKKKKSKNVAAFNNKEVCEILETILNQSSFAKFFPSPPPIPTYSAEYNNISILRGSIFCAGRYNKYSRDLSQTPWILDGERKMENSVQEIIVTTLESSFKSEGSRFSSSGREDVDVRTLGKGRPFVVELLNPHISSLSEIEIRNLEKQINNGGLGLVSIRDLQIISRDDVKHLKTGEEEKIKEYCAFCIIHGTVSLELLQQCCSLAPFTIQQKTPIRVLHRRTVATRPRLIHTMRIEPAGIAFPEGKTLVKLYVRTQAGTYVKEFVHGDFGRTSPSFSELIGDIPADVLALDVMNIELDWPSPVNY